jgi:proteic killer suppression protein
MMGVFQKLDVYSLGYIIDCVQILYKSKKIKRICTIFYEAQKKYGTKMAEKIHLRIEEISAADTVEDMIQFKIGRCHTLHGTRIGQYAVDLIHPYRLVFEKTGNTIQVATIIEVVDYH